ncbi:MAG: hypothetical protein HY296_06290 [Thaumarchaeota archaeon]|nr:hypothetical protein [Nitrososphaerota archaeon]
MSNLGESPFIEHLLTLGGLLAVFLGLSLQSNVINQPLIFMGTTFAVSALLTYTTFLFGEKPTKSKVAGYLRIAIYSVLGGSFSGIVFLAYSYAFTGAGAGNIYEAVGIIGVLTALFFVLYRFILRVLEKQDSVRNEVR